MSQTKKSSSKAQIYDKVILLVNTKSRKSEQLSSKAQRLLRKKGIKLAKVMEVKKPKNLDQAFDRALKLKPSLLIVGGGDGTVSRLAGRLAYSKTALGVLPLGTTNNFARSLNLPLQLEADIDVITSGKLASIDLGKIDKRYFANVATLGLSVKIADSVPHGLKRRLGRLAYGITSLKTLLTHRAFRVTITSGSDKMDLRTHQIIIANGSSHSGIPIATDAHVDDNLLTIFKVGGISRWHLIWDMLQIATLSRYRKLSHGMFINTKRATIKTSPAQQVEIDGEVLATTPVTVSVASDALKVMVPSDFTDN